MAAPGHRCLKHDSRRKDYQLESFYAARTVARNLTTSAFRRLFSLESSCADESTCEEAEPGSPAPRLTSALLVATWLEPIPACCPLPPISWAPPPCSATAAPTP